MHIQSIGAGMFSGMAVAMPLADLTLAQIQALSDYTGFSALFAKEIKAQGGTKAPGTFVDMSNVREFPPLGTPPNVVNVPNYGSSTSKQIQGQADPNSMEITLNYVPADWAKGTLLGDAVGDGKLRVFRFAMLNSQPTGTGDTRLASAAAGLGVVENSQWFFIGKMEAQQVTPNLTDANTATVTITLQSAFFGAFTAAPTP